MRGVHPILLVLEESEREYLEACSKVLSLPFTSMILFVIPYIKKYRGMLTK